MGVALTNTDYWTVVFDLERFVTKANGNFTVRVEEMTTLTATFPTNKDEWVIWGGILYRANTNIIAGDQYVENSNITKITVEEVVGYVERLKTTAKDNLVNAINELFDGEVDINNIIGALSNLATTDKTSIVNAINELVTAMGALSNLATTDKTSVVNAINEVLSTANARINTLNNYIGNLQNLNTTDKSSIVNAINEVLNTITSDISTAIATINATIGNLSTLVTADKSSVVNAINETKGELNALSQLFNGLVIPKNRQIIIIGDSYGMRNTPNYMQFLTARYPDNIRGQALSSYGFVPFTSNNKNFYNILYDYFTSQMTSAERALITDVVYLGGWNDAHRIALGEADGNSILGYIHNAIRDTTADFPNCKVWIGFNGWQSYGALENVPAGETYPSFDNLRATELVYTSFIYPNGYTLKAIKYIMRDPHNIDETFFHPNGSGGYRMAYALIGELFGHWDYNQYYNIGMSNLENVGVITVMAGYWAIENDRVDLLINIRCNGSVTDGLIGKLKQSETFGTTTDGSPVIVCAFNGTVNGSTYAGSMLLTLSNTGNLVVRLPDFTSVTSLNGRVYGRATINNKYNF